jgi:hypothetical protein
MIDTERAARWATDAGIALMRNFDRNEEVVRLASIVLVLLADRQSRERFIERIGVQADELSC